MAVDAIAILASALLAVGIPAEPAAEVNTEEVICLADNVYWESRGESDKGRKAVAYATLHRVTQPGWPDSICDVVWEKRRAGKKYVAQFSWTLDGKSDTVQKAEAAVWQECLEVALKVLYRRVPDPTREIGGATHFYAHGTVKPDWGVNAKKRKVIGNHTFVRLD